jgi:hypothetical protein
MHGLTCDLCGGNLLVDADVRYVVRIDVFAAYDPLEITAGDLSGDLEGEVARLLRDCEGHDAEELQDQVHRRFEFDCCPPCQRRVLRDPIAGLRRPPGGAAPPETLEETHGDRE